MNRVDPRARPRRDLRHRARATAGPRLVANAYLEGTYSEVYPSITRDEDGLRRLFRQFSFPGGIPQPRRARDAGLDPRGRRARLRARRTPTAPRSTTPTSSSAASSATARPRPGRWRRAGTRTSSSTRRATARCCRSCTSTATRSPTRRSSPGSRDDELRALLEGYGYAAALRRGRRPGGDAPADGARRSTRSSTRSRAIQRRGPRRRRRPSRPRWPMIVLRTPKGWTGPEGRRRPAGRGHVARPPGAAGRGPDEPGAPRPARGVDALATGPRSCSTTTGGRAPEIRALAPRGDAPDERQPARQRRPAAARPRPARLPRLRASTCRRPGAVIERGDARARRRGCATSSATTRRPSGSSGPTRPRRTGSTPCSRSTDRAWMAEIAARRRPPRARRAA